ncbi:ParA family protein [Bradyrhizobium sp. JYMT SZCCT0180]|uniref:ParA family protein n=1 Tax=Bradyrhizobium sp. JYMT SZCCT0180 TaxID=2807666 RepID=UPI001BAA6972|nr:ParA family protein [Bradyrhizobium sp. JYMT SZCCT0180]MBR1215556.1 ParA family protein [Bradyrhizobium sp. JYMT SZCCT0180]
MTEIGRGQMKVLATVQQKGGTGKSTASLNVAVAAALQGYRVAVLDTDPQGSLQLWRNLRRKRWPCVEELRSEALAGWLARNRLLFDLVVVDTPAHDGNTIADAVNVAHLALIVTQPTMLATSVAMRLRNLFIDHDIPFAILLSQTPPTLTARLVQWTDNHRRLGTVVQGQLAYRFAYQDAIAVGMGVVEYEPDGRAATEVQIVTEWILRRLELLNEP